MTISDYIKLRGITRSAFSQLVGVEKSLVSKWMAGTVRPSPEHYQNIFNATNGAVTPNDFFHFMTPLQPNSNDVAETSTENNRKKVS